MKKCHPIFKRLEDAYKEKYGDPEYAKEQLKQLQKKTKYLRPAAAVTAAGLFYFQLTTGMNTILVRISCKQKYIY